MMSRSLPAILIAAAALLQPTWAVALPRGATTPISGWLVGTWVFKGGKCSESGTVHLANGRMGTTGPGNTISIIGRYSLRGNILTEIVESEQYGDLTNVTRIGAIGANELVSEPLNNKDPNVFIPPQRRCPEQPGVEPWFPRIRFQGMTAYRVLPDRSTGGAGSASRRAPSAGASSPSIPQRYWGRWEAFPKDCADPDSVMKIVIAARTIAYRGQTQTLVAVRELAGGATELDVNTREHDSDYGLPPVTRDKVVLRMTGPNRVTGIGNMTRCPSR